VNIEELINKLTQYDLNKQVKGTWESIEQDINEIYEENGIVYIDVDQK
jgi:CMP-N-acetylneuraminic acid synthetase